MDWLIAIGIILAGGFIVAGLLSRKDNVEERYGAFLVARKRGRFRPER